MCVGGGGGGAKTSLLVIRECTIQELHLNRGLI